jgi:glycosyltransferase involved in cell wall biosynthesis
MSPVPPAPALIPLPAGRALSGVARFAADLASELAERGRPVALVFHAHPADHPPLDLPIHPAVRTADLSHLPPLDDPSADPATYLPAYADALASLANTRPACLIAGQHAATFGIAAALSQTTHHLRVLGVAHSDNAYDTHLLAHYEPLLTRLVAVSTALRDDLITLLPARAADIAHIPYGVRVPDTCPPRTPLTGRPLRLIYAGRLEHRQKRVLALAHLARELRQRRIDHTLTIVGDGPARPDLQHAARSEPTITIAPPVAPRDLDALLAVHDAFVLPSRYEGLSIAMLEALAQGCVPVVTPSRSGTRDAVTQGVIGEIASASPDDDEPAAAAALADAIDALRRRDLAEMARRAHRAARERFSIAAHADAWERLIDHAADAPRRVWPAERPCAYGPSGSVPHDAPDRMRRALDAIGALPVCIHGAGAHTRALAHVIDRSSVVAIADDDRQRHGSTMLGRPIIHPARAAETGARHVIISSHLHEEDIWARRAVYEAQGLAVHRLYAAAEHP